MKKITLLLLLSTFLLPNKAVAQDWKIYSDSIYSNILRSNNSKAKEFLVLANRNLRTNKIVKDTIYADFLYRKGLVHYYTQENSLNYFQESLNLWEESGLFNPTKIMKIHYFIAEALWINSDYKLAYESYKKCYEINKKYNIPVNGNYTGSLYNLSRVDYFYNNYDDAKKYGLEYIGLIKDNAFSNLDMRLINAIKFTLDTIEMERMLIKYLDSYLEREINNPILLYQIHYELMSVYGNNRNIREIISHGEKAHNLYQENNLDNEYELEAILSNLIWSYESYENDVKSKEYKDIYFELFPEEKDPINTLSELQQLGKNEEFQEKFLIFEASLIQQNDYETLLRIYEFSLSYFQLGLLYTQEEIQSQINTISLNENHLDDVHIDLFNFTKGRYFFSTKEYLKSINNLNKAVKSDNTIIRISALSLKSTAEALLGIPNSIETSYQALNEAIMIYGKESPQILSTISKAMANYQTGFDKRFYKIGTMAMEIIEKNSMENTVAAAGIYSALGNMANFGGNYSDALTFFKKSIAIQENNHPINIFSYYSNYLGLSMAYSFKREHDLAFENLKKIKIYLDSSENKSELMNVAYGDFFNSLARAYLNYGDFELAKSYYEKSLENYGGVLSRGRNYELILCEYFIDKDIDKTIVKLEEYYKQNGDFNGSVLKNLYLLKYNNGLVIDARTTLTESIKNVIANNTSYFHLLSDAERELIYNNFENQFEYLNTHLLSEKDNDYLNQFIEYRFYYKSLLFNNSKNKLDYSSDKQYLGELKSNNILLNKYYESDQNFETEISTILNRNTVLEKYLAQNKPVDEIPTLKELNSRLNENEAYVEIIRINKQSISDDISDQIVNTFSDSIYYGAIIIKKNVQPKFVIIDDKNNLEVTDFQYFQNHISGENRFITDNDSYNLLFKPIAQELDGIKTVYLSVDGIYNSLNIESIFNPERGKYVMEYLDVRQVLSVKSVINYSKNQLNDFELTATIMGNPEFELNSGDLVEVSSEDILRESNVDYFREYNSSKTISYLPGTEMEINSISDILKQSDWAVELYASQGATEENLKSVNSPNILHIATHGFFLEEKKVDNSKNLLLGLQANNMQSNVYLRSGLLFSGAQNTINGDNINQRDNGVFTAQEAKSLNLSNTNLVVLSACETGLGQNQSGEGVYGLQRAFMIAGAKSVIMSLWKVDDATTQKLMTAFYTNLVDKKLSIHDAFQKAKLEIKEQYPEPFYWAPFVLIE